MFGRSLESRAGYDKYFEWPSAIMVKQSHFLVLCFVLRGWEWVLCCFSSCSFFPSSHLHLREVVTWTIWAKCNEKMPWARQWPHVHELVMSFRWFVDICCTTVAGWAGRSQHRWWFFGTLWSSISSAQHWHAWRWSTSFAGDCKHYNVPGQQTLWLFQLELMWPFSSLGDPDFHCNSLCHLSSFAKSQPPMMFWYPCSRSIHSTLSSQHVGIKALRLKCVHQVSKNPETKSKPNQSNTIW